MQDYRALRWEPARAKLAALSAADPDRLIYRMYLERIDELSQQVLPEGWDGVFTHTSK